MMFYFWSGLTILVSSFFLEVICIKKEELLINDDIKDKEVRVVNEQGEMLGIMTLEKALELAYSQDLDLVKIGAGSVPPVCKIMNYGKYKFEIEKRERLTKKNQKVVDIKEIRISPTIESHDFEFKVKNAKKFLLAGDKLRLTVRFRGREVNYIKLGEDVLNKFADELSDCGVVEKSAKLEGKNMSLTMGPKINNN